MRDAIGNKLEAGQWVHWMPEQFVKDRGVVCIVANVSEGAMRDEHGRPLRDPMITIQVTIPLDTSRLRPGEEPQIMQFMRVVSPRSDKIIDSLLDGTGAGSVKQ